MEKNLKVMSELVHYLRYAKYIPELQRRETWEETCNRNKEMHQRKYPFLKEEIEEVYNKFVIPKKVLPSMRSMQYGGKAIEINNTRIYNCSFLPADCKESFSETMFLLLSGSGVGYSVQKVHTSKLPRICHPFRRKKYVVSDDIIGWSEAVRVLINAYMGGGFYPEFNFDEIRPKGSRLKTAGGKAPGPEPLKRCLKNIDKLLSKKKNGSKLVPLEVHDIMCYVAQAVISGGVRLAAMICFFDKDDEMMLTCKGNFKLKIVDSTPMGDNMYEVNLIDKVTSKEYSLNLDEDTFKKLSDNGELPWWYFEPQRARANNSAVFLRHAVKKSDFKKFWKIVEENKTGEPGVFFSNSVDMMSNPCQPSYATVLTPDGIRQFKDIKEGSIIWSGKRWTTVTKKWSTGVKPVYTYNTSAGYFLGTENHKVYQNGEKVEVGEAFSIDKSVGEYDSSFFRNTNDVIDGMVIGGGTVHKASNNLVLLQIEEKEKNELLDSEIAKHIKCHRPGIRNTAYEIETSVTHSELPETFDRVIPDRFIYGDRNKKINFLRGLFSANGSAFNTKSSKRISLKQSSFTLIKQVQTMLSSLGIYSYITENKLRKNEFYNGAYECKISYNLNITSDRLKFKELIGFIQQHKMDSIGGEISNKEKISFDIKNIEYIEDTEVFDITVDDPEHTYWTGGCLVSNCVEASLRSNTYCNLTEINDADINSQEELNERAKAAAFIGTLQAGYLDFHYLRDIWEENTKQDSLLGVSLTGMATGHVNSFDYSEAAREAKEVNEMIAKRLDIKPAARVTNVKPAGSTSLIFGCSSGIHAWFSEQYLRRIKINKSDAIYGYLSKELPDFIEDDRFDPNNFSFIKIPIKAPEGSLIASKESALEFLERIKHVFHDWVENGHRFGDNTHNISATVYIKKDEWKDVGEWMWDNRNSYNGIAVLPYDDNTYIQAPLEAIDEDTYNELVSRFKDINLTEVIEVEDNTEITQSVACAGGSCEIT